MFQLSRRCASSLKSGAPKRRNILGLDELAKYVPIKIINSSDSIATSEVPASTIKKVSSAGQTSQAPTKLFSSILARNINVTKENQTQRFQDTRRILAPLKQAMVRSRQKASTLEEIALLDDVPKSLAQRNHKYRLPQSNLVRKKASLTAADPQHLVHIPTSTRQKLFSELRLPTWLVNALSSQNIIQPTNVQQRIIEAMLEETSETQRKLRPILIKGQTGTGKSLGYIIALLAQLHRESSAKISNLIGVSSCFHLVLVPNAILAQQLLRWVRLLVTENSYLTENLRSIVRLMLPKTELDQIEGDYPPEIIQPGFSHIMIATPNQVRDSLATGHFNLSHLRDVIVDEADALLKSLSSYATLKEKLNRARHPVPAMSLLKEIRSTCREYDLHQPRLIVASASLNRRCREDLQEAGLVTGAYTLIRDSACTPTCPASIKHFYRMLSSSESIEELVQLIQWIWMERSGETGVLFVPAARSKTALQGWLEAAGIRAYILSELPTSDQAALLEITSGGAILLGSDIDARGWDLPMLKYVIVVDLPASPTHYLHMAGRVGRMGSPGCAYTFVAGHQDLERLTNIYSILRLSATPYLPRQ